MPQKDAEPEYSKSTEQLYKEGLRSEEQPAEERKGRKMVVEGNDLSAYVGVDPVYQNYADDTSKPYATEEGSADAAIVDEFVAAQQHTVSTVEGEASKDDAAPATAESTEVSATGDMGTKSTLTTPASRPADKAAATKKS